LKCSKTKAFKKDYRLWVKAKAVSQGHGRACRLFYFHSHVQGRCSVPRGAVAQQLAVADNHAQQIVVEVVRDFLTGVKNEPTALTHFRCQRTLIAVKRASAYCPGECPSAKNLDRATASAAQSGHRY